MMDFHFIFHVLSVAWHWYAVHHLAAGAIPFVFGVTADKPSVTDSTAVSSTGTTVRITYLINQTDTTAVSDIAGKLDDTAYMREAVTVVLAISPLQVNVTDSTAISETKAIGFVSSFSVTEPAQALEFINNAQLIDAQSYVGANPNTNLFVFTANYAGSLFNGNGDKAGSISLYIEKIGSPSGNLTVKLFATSGTAPTGAALATSDAIDSTTLPTSFGLVSFPFSGANQITLTNGVVYAWVLEGDIGTFGNMAGMVNAPSGTLNSNTTTNSGSSWFTTFGARGAFYLYNTAPQNFMEEFSFPNVTDTTAVSDTPTVYITTLFLNVTDSSAVTDVILIQEVDLISKTESTAVSDTPTIQIVSTLSVTDSSAVSDTPTIRITSFVNVTDTTTVTDTPIILIPILVLNVTDSTVVSDSPILTVGIANATIAVIDYAYTVDSTLNQSVDSNAVESVVGGSAGSGESGQELAQSFIAISDSLTQIDLKCFKNGTPVDNILLDIVSALDGVSLGNVTIPASSFGAGTITSFVFSSPVTLIPGNSYFFQLSRSGARDVTNNISFYVNTNNQTYNGTVSSLNRRGNNTWSDLHEDMRFVIYFSDLQTVAIASGNLTVNVTDSTAATDTPIVEIISLVSVTDSSAVSDTPTIELFSFISVTDSTAVTDTPIIRLFSFVNVTDSTATTDTPTILIPILVPNVSDSTAVTDTPIIEIFSFINVTDSSAVTDTPSLSIPLPVTVTDSTAATDTPFIQEVDLILVTDSSAVTDTPIIRMFSFVTVTDTSAITETVIIEDFEQGIVITDSTTVSDTPIIEIFSFIAVTDTSAVTDTPIVEIISFVNKTDSTAVTDTPIIEEILLILKTDSTAVTDTPIVEVISQIVVTDSTAIGETVTMELFSFVNVTDSVAVSDTPTVVIVNAGTDVMSVQDSSPVNDTVIVMMQYWVPSVSDSSAVTAVPIIESLSNVNVTDSSAVSDTPILSLTSYINVTDSSVVTDTPIFEEIDEGIVVTDSSTVTDTPIVEMISFVNKTDSTAVSDIRIIEEVDLIAVTDSSSVSDTPALSVLLQVSVTDTSAVSDIVHVKEDIATFNVTDTVSISEHVALRVAVPPTFKIHIVQLGWHASRYQIRLGWRKSGYIVQMNRKKSPYTIKLS